MNDGSSNCPAMLFFAFKCEKFLSLGEILQGVVFSYGKENCRDPSNSLGLGPICNIWPTKFVQTKMAFQIKLPWKAKMTPQCIRAMSKMTPQFILAMSKMSLRCILLVYRIVWANRPFWSVQYQFLRVFYTCNAWFTFQYVKLQFCLCSAFGGFSLTLFSQTSLVVFEGPDNLILNYTSLSLGFYHVCFINPVRLGGFF